VSSTAQVGCCGGFVMMMRRRLMLGCKIHDVMMKHKDVNNSHRDQTRRGLYPGDGQVDQK